MKRTMIVLTALLCVGLPSAAAADDDITADLLDRITRLQDRNADLRDQVEHKSDVIACERAKRRQLERALRTGEPVSFPASCR